MAFLFSLYQQPGWFISALILLSLWNLVWKGLGLWYAGKHQQKGWFIVMLIIDIFGLLPIIYLLWFRPVEKVPRERSVSVRKRPVRKSI